MPSPPFTPSHRAGSQARLDRVITELVDAPGVLDVSRRARESL